MKSFPDVQPRTRLFARVLGPYLVIASLSAVLRTPEMRRLMTEYADAAWPWVTGAFVLPMGLTVVVLHPYWRGAAAATVSLLGWLTAVKGVALMAAPPAYLAWGSGIVGVAPWWQASAVTAALVGLYLTLIGWVPAASRPAVRDTERRTYDVPNAA